MRVAGVSIVHSSNTRAIAAWTLAVLVAAISVGGLVTGAYSRETAAWRAQAIGQDWFDLVVVVPWLIVCGTFARRGSYPWRVLLAGAYAYTTYELLIYVFAVRFNALFLVYCAALGLSSYALLALVGELRRHSPLLGRRAAHVAGGFLVTIGILFALLWLVEDVPAILRGAPPPSLVETGLPTNPVHAIDLAFVLPAHVIVGALVWRRRAIGRLYAPILLAFGALMAASIGAMLVVIRLLGGSAAFPVAIAMFVVATACSTVLARILHEPV